MREIAFKEFVKKSFEFSMENINTLFAIVNPTHFEFLQGIHCFVGARLRKASRKSTRVA